MLLLPGNNFLKKISEDFFFICWFWELQLALSGYEINENKNKTTPLFRKE